MTEIVKKYTQFAFDSFELNRIFALPYTTNNPSMRVLEKAGFELVNFITVTLATHDRNNASRFAELIARLPEVQEAHALTGEMDYILKVVTPDLRGLSAFVNDMLLPHDAVQNVKTAIVLQTLKETTALPL